MTLYMVKVEMIHIFTAEETATTQYMTIPEIIDLYSKIYHLMM